MSSSIGESDWKEFMKTLSSSFSRESSKGFRIEDRKWPWTSISNDIDSFQRRMNQGNANYDHSDYISGTFFFNYTGNFKQCKLEAIWIIQENFWKILMLLGKIVPQCCSSTVDSVVCFMNAFRSRRIETAEHKKFSGRRMNIKHRNDVLSVEEKSSCSRNWIEMFS